jgi:phenylalanyl-tRNA synthetase beta chain
MNVSYNWLKEYVTFERTPSELANKLTMAGFEVEEVRALVPEFSGITVAEIVEVAKHPNADKLSICRVQTGSERAEVVCGAPNVAVGQKVAFAPVDTVLPNGIKIKKAKIRGIASYGMICSEQELGLTDHSDGIWVLPDAWRTGADVYRNLGGRQDYILDIAVTPNRPDGLSIIGIAREISVLEKAELRLPAVRVTEHPIPKNSAIDVYIDKDALVGCPRYTARLITDVTIAPSPDWLVERLNAVGVRAINNVVDITNFVLFEFGHPLHAFDLQYIEGNKIIVRTSRQNEIFITLDGTERRIPEDTVMICDAQKAVAIGGIMGGLNSEVADSTTTILLESAYFNPAHIASSSKRLALSTEASQRFERGVDPNGAVLASNRAAALIADIAGGNVIRGLIDSYPTKIKAKKIRVRPARVNHVLGTSLPTSKMTDILNRLGLSYQNETVTAPTFRPDIEREVDVIEEIARIIDYDTIPVKASTAIKMDAEANPDDLLYDRIKRVCCEIGMTEVITNSMIAKKEIEAVKDQIHVTVLNPISDDMNAMRPSLLPGLLKVAAYNINRQNQDMRLFELGRIFRKDAAIKPEQQVYALGFLVHGGRYRSGWEGTVVPVDIYDIKGLVEAFCAKIFLDNLDFILYDRNGYFRSGHALAISRKGRYLGGFGQIKPEIAAVFGIESTVYGFEIDISGIEALISPRVLYQPFSRYPAIEKDLALIVEGNLEAEELRLYISKAGQPLAQEVVVFDLFQGKHLEAGKKSIGFRIRFQSKERTLKDREVSKVFEEIINQVEKKFNAKLRK